MNPTSESRVKKPNSAWGSPSDGAEIHDPSPPPSPSRSSSLPPTQSPTIEKTEAKAKTKSKSISSNAAPQHVSQNAAGIFEYGSRESGCTPLQSLWQAILVWFKISAQSLPVLVFVTLFMWLYYLPAIMTRSKIPAFLDNTIYGTMREIFRRFFIYGAYCLFGVEIWSFRVARDALLWVGLPIFVVNSLFAGLGAIYGVSPAFIELVSYAFTIITPFIGLFFIHRWAKPLDPSEYNPQEADAYMLTQDGTPIAIAKGLIGFYSVFVIFRYTLDFYLASSFAVQIIIRVILLPFSFMLANSFQHAVMVGLSLEHMQRRLLVAVCTGQYLQFFGRLMVSNVADAGGESSPRFLAMNLIMMVVEFLSRISYIQRLRWIQDVYNAYYEWKTQVDGNSANSSSSRLRIQSNAGAVQGQQDDPPKDKTFLELMNLVRAPNSPEQDISHYTRQIRAQQIALDIGMEIRVLALVPLLLYFLDPLYPNSEFQTIDNLESTVYQILVQLACEWVGDVASIFVEIRYLQIPLSLRTVKWQDTGSLVKTLFSLFCVMFLHYLVSISE